MSCLPYSTTGRSPRVSTANYPPCRMEAGVDGTPSASLRLDDHLQRMRIDGLSEGIVGFHDVVQAEPVGDELAGFQAPGTHGLEQHGRADGIDQPCRNRDVAVPQAFHMQVDFHAMHADIAMGPPGAMNDSHNSKLAGTPTASIAQSTPTLPVSFMISATGSPLELFTHAVAP